jgi:hypothetical protein
MLRFECAAVFRGLCTLDDGEAQEAKASGFPIQMLALDADLALIMTHGGFLYGTALLLCDSSVCAPFFLTVASYCCSRDCFSPASLVISLRWGFAPASVLHLRILDLFPHLY